MNISNVVEAYIGLRGQVIDLWVWFVAGNFAALAACFSVDRMSGLVRALFIAGFLVYAVGNLTLILSNTQIMNALVANIRAELGNAGSYMNSLTELSQKHTARWIPVSFHVLVDLVVVLIIALYRKP